MRKTSAKSIVFYLTCLASCFSFHGHANNRHGHNHENITKSTVNLTCNKKMSSVHQPWVHSDFKYYSGSGFIIQHNNKKYILTNAHVVKDAVSIRVRKAGSDDEYTAIVEYFSGARDLALISPVDDTFFNGTETMTLKEEVNIGDKVSSFGFPMGGNTITMTDGIISRIDFGAYSSFGFANLRFQIDAALNFGSSGGPAINDNAVIGVNFSGLVQGQNIGYIIPSSVVNQFLADIDKSPQTPPHVSDVPFLSINTIPLQSPQLRKVLSLHDNETGILITETSEIEKDKGFLQVDDVLLSIDDHAIGNQGNIYLGNNDNISWKALINGKQIGENVQLKLKREGKTITITYPLTHNLSDSLIVPSYKFQEDMDYIVLGGVVFVELTQTVLDAYDLRHQPHIWPYINSFREKHSSKTEKIIIVTNILYHPINLYYDPTAYQMTVLNTFNNEKVKNLTHFKALIQQSQNEGGNLMMKGTTFEKKPISIGFSWDDLNQTRNEFITQYGLRKNVF